MKQSSNATKQSKSKNLKIDCFFIVETEISNWGCASKNEEIKNLKTNVMRKDAFERDVSLLGLISWVRIVKVQTKF